MRLPKALNAFRGPVTRLKTDAHGSVRDARNWREQLAPTGLGFLLGISICAPFFRGGRLLLLDWVLGPRSAVFNPTYYGLHGGINGAFLFGILATSFGHVLGPSMTWLPVFLFFPFACYTMSQLVSGGMVAKLAAGIIFTMNPFVTDRIYAGQLSLIYGYALLPILFKWVSEWISGQKPRVARLALLLTLMVSIDVHFAWIDGAVLLAGSLTGIRRNEFRLSVLRLFFLLIPLNIYLAIPVLGHQLPVNAGDNGVLLRDFQTLSDPHLGLFVNVLGLYGFWRPMRESSKSLLIGWPFFLAAILMVSVYGIWQLSKRDRQFSIFIALLFPIAYFLALGAQGPTSTIFRLAYENVPGFSMMREPEKFSAITATIVALLFGEGVAKIAVAQTSKKAGLSIVSLGLLLGAAYNPVAYWGIHGQLQNSNIPSDWTAAANKVAGAQGKTLVLPWHQYLSFPFTNDRIIANPAKSFLPGDIISGDNIQMTNLYTAATSQRSAYLDWLLSHLQLIHNFGALISPLGVEYVVIYKTASTGDISWISHQRDLTMEYSSHDVEILKNNAFSGIAMPILGPQTSSFNQILQASQAGTAAGKIDARVRIIKETPTSLTFAASAAGWVRLSIPFEKGYVYNSLTPIEESYGTMALSVKKGVTTIKYSPWTLVFIGYATSALATLTLLLLTLSTYFTQPSLQQPKDDTAQTGAYRAS